MNRLTIGLFALWSALLASWLGLRGVLAVRHASHSKWDESAFGHLIKLFLHHDSFPHYRYAIFALFIIPLIALLKDLRLEEEAVRKYNGVLVLAFIPLAFIYILFVYGVYYSPSLTFLF